MVMDKTFLILTIIFLVVAFMVLYLLLKNRKSSSSGELEETKKQLHSYMSKVDDLMFTLNSIHEFSLQVTGIASREDLAKYIVDLACKLFDAGTGSVMLINPKTSELEIVASKGLPAEITSSAKPKLGEGIAGKVAETGKPIFVEDITTDPRFNNKTGNGYSSKSFLSVPMTVKDHVIGVVNVTPRKKIETYEDKSIRLLSILADQSAFALENLRLYGNLEKFYMDMVEILAKTVDVKDSYTYDHAERARTHARKICKQLNLPEGITKPIEYAALIHDIGKIGIEHQILEKPGNLTPEERKSVEQHPAIGSNIIKPVVFLSSIAPIILYHQEWYNGRGYPEKLQGEEIPLGARIVAVIDAYDAMVSDRPYRKTMAKEKAIEELKRYSGVQFDTEVVNAFLQVLE